MRVCNKCKSSKIKTRTNSPFGRKSRPVTSAAFCKSCGSTDISAEKQRGRRRGRRR